MKKSLAEWFLVIQHVMAMFGSTVLVPILIGIPVSLALLSAGMGTLIFHVVTKGKVPSFLGSSFAFVSPMLLVLETHSVAYLKGGIIITGVLYLFYALLAKVLGEKRISSWFPPIVVGSLIISIGLKLVPTALAMCGYTPEGLDYHNLFLAVVTISILATFSVAQNSFFRLVPILFAILGAYVVAMALGMVNFAPVLQAQWFGLDAKALAVLAETPKFSMNTVLILAPISLVVLAEHIDDVKYSSAVTGNNFLVDPGLHRTLMGDGLASILAGLLGGPGNVTYSENTSVLSITKVYNPAILRRAAVVAIILAFMGKFVAILQSLPEAITGAVSLVLISLIVVVGLCVLMESKVDLRNIRNMLIPALVIVVGAFVSDVEITEKLVIPGSFLAMVIGIILNQVFIRRNEAAVRRARRRKKS